MASDDGFHVRCCAIADFNCVSIEELVELMIIREMFINEVQK